MSSYHCLTKPKQIIVMPQRMVIDGRNVRGPNFRSTTVAGGCSNTYEMKNIKTMTEYRSPMSFKSTPMPATTAIPLRMLAIENTRAIAAGLAYGVRAVHQRDTVHATESQDETPVDSSDDLFLLLWCEGIDVGIVHGIGVFGEGALEVFDSTILLNLRRIEVGDWGRHGWK